MRKLALFLFAAALTLPALAQNLRVSQRTTSTVSSNLAGPISATSVTDRSRHYGGAVTGSVVHQHSHITVSPSKIFKIDIDGGQVSNRWL